MEISEKELENVISYPGHEVSEDIALSNASLYRQEAIEKLKQQRAELQKDELTMEELEQIQAGVPRR